MNKQFLTIINNDGFVNRIDAETCALLHGTFVLGIDHIFSTTFQAHDVYSLLHADSDRVNNYGYETLGSKKDNYLHGEYHANTPAEVNQVSSCGPSGNRVNGFSVHDFGYGSDCARDDASGG